MNTSTRRAARPSSEFSSPPGLAQAGSGLTGSVINPTNGEKITQIVEGTEADVDKALDAARVAFDTTWGTNTPGFERGKILIKVAELIERDIDILASIEALDNGKAFGAAKGFDVSVS